MRLGSTAAAAFAMAAVVASWPAAARRAAGSLSHASFLGAEPGENAVAGGTENPHVAELRARVSGLESAVESLEGSLDRATEPPRTWQPPGGGEALSARLAREIASRAAAEEKLAGAAEVVAAADAAATEKARAAEAAAEAARAAAAEDDARSAAAAALEEELGEAVGDAEAAADEKLVADVHDELAAAPPPRAVEQKILAKEEARVREDLGDASRAESAAEEEHAARKRDERAEAGKSQRAAQQLRAAEAAEKQAVGCQRPAEAVIAADAIGESGSGGGADNADNAAVAGGGNVAAAEPSAAEETASNDESTEAAETEEDPTAWEEESASAAPLAVEQLAVATAMRARRPRRPFPPAGAVDQQPGVANRQPPDQSSALRLRDLAKFLKQRAEGEPAEKAHEGRKEDLDEGKGEAEEEAAGEAAPEEPVAETGGTAETPADWHEWVYVGGVYPAGLAAALLALAIHL